MSKDEDLSAACTSIALKTVHDLARSLELLSQELESEREGLDPTPVYLAEAASRVQRTLSSLANRFVTLTDCRESVEDSEVTQMVDELFSIRLSLHREVLERSKNAPTKVRNAPVSSVVGKSIAKAVGRCRTLVTKLEAMSSQLVPTPRVQVKERQMCVASVDLSQYGKKAAVLETIVRTPRVLLEFNDRLLNEVRAILKRLQISDSPVIATGDGALVFFKKADKADAFGVAIQLYAVSQRGTQNKDLECYFRVGICTGDLAYRLQYPQKSLEVAGMPIIRAVRIEAASRTGEVWICDHTFAQLSTSRKRTYGAPFEIRGKPHEANIRVRSKVVTAPAPWESKRQKSPGRGKSR